MSYKPFRPNQMELMSAILAELKRQKPEYNPDVPVMNKAIEAANLMCNECSRERVYADKPMTPEEWLISDDVGVSSKYMLSVLIGRAFSDDGPTPRDAADLGRCIRMVTSCALENKIEALFEAGPKWTTIAEHWHELVELYNQEKYESIYDFLKKLDD
ncbi:hypothetical protein [Vibrio barjaei]|uniref:hypothetical protein n=1 Tax=Vibrio barjaei TaxID=1676683 RepID=UPI002285138B|nr:hypothetical protein [Vibrio barjaei]MCY9870390.1 hypothetical protein [Vibrio barjaei]